MTMLTEGLAKSHAIQTTEETPTTNSISHAFDAVFFGENVEAVLPLLEEYLADKSIRGLKQTNPTELLEKALALMPEEQQEMHPFNRDKLKAILELYIQTGIQVHSTGSMGRQFSGVVPLAAVIDMVSSVVNQPSSFYEAAQLPNIAEHIMAKELNRFIGYDEEQFTMITTSGGSLANLTALLAARNNKYPNAWTDGMNNIPGWMKPAIAISEEAHYSICRAVGILGIGEKQVVRLPINKEGQIDTSKVQPILDNAKAAGLDVFCMVASAGTTAVGAFDDLDTLTTIAAANKLWLHVDGSHGASLMVSDFQRFKLKGIEKVDSISWDAHKMLFVPSPCSLLFYKDKTKAYGAFKQVASYVFEKEPTIYSQFESAEKNFECTKRPMIMNLWVLWAVHGRALFSGKIDYLCSLTKQAYHVLEHDANFETLHHPQCNILCFRYAPKSIQHEHIQDFQIKIRNSISDNGEFFISKVDIDGEAALRVVFMNHEIKITHFHMLLQAIEETGQQIIAEHKELNRITQIA